MRRLESVFPEIIHPDAYRAIQTYRETGLVDWTLPDGVPPLRIVKTDDIECEECADRGFISVPRADEPLSDYVECTACKLVEHRRVRRLLDKVPTDYRQASIAGFKRAAKNDGAAAIADVLESWSDTPRGSALVWGPIGGLKTTLMSAVWTRLVFNGTAKTAEWVTLPDILAEIRRSYDHEAGMPTPSDVIDRIATADVALLDDLGAEYVKATNAQWVEEQLYRIINRRSNDHRWTLFTSNLSMQELGTRVGPRILSRIEGMCLPRLWQLDQGVDFRLVPND